jgi:hypothetical protein
MKARRILIYGSVVITILFVVIGFTKVYFLLSPVTLISTFPQFNGLFGVSVAGVGDLNNDGIDDIVIGANGEDAADISAAGRVYVFSGATDDTLFTLNSPFPEIGGNFGSSLSNAGDVNNDGKNDIIVGAQGEDAFGIRDAGRAYVFNGANGDTLFTLQSHFPDLFGNFGAAVSGAGDVNNDGMSDVIVGAERENVSSLSNAGIAYVFSGATGDTLFILKSVKPETGGLFGISVSEAGDINKDGHSDLVIGSLENVQFENSGRIYTFSGATGDTLHILETPFPRTDGAFGREVSNVGDLNGDDTSDIVIAAPGEVFRVYIYSGATGDTLFTLKSPSEQNIGFGSVISDAGDVDNDQVNDIIVGAPLENWGGFNNAGRAYIYSGKSGELLHALQSPNPEVEAFFGNAVSRVGNISNDDSSDVIIGAHGEDVADLQSAGRAYLFKSGVSTSINSQSGNLPSKFKLGQNNPNPFNPRTIINYELPITNYVELNIYDNVGRRVATLVSENKPTGKHQVEWDATGFASGVYYYRLNTDAGFVQTRKLMLLK